MGNTAVMQAMGNFGKGEFIIKQQLFCFLNFMDDDELLEGNAFNFGEDICQTGIVITQFFADVNGVIYLRLFLGRIDHVCNQRLYLVNQLAFAIVQ